MTIIKNNRLIQTIFREPVDATPIWIMRQAGRYLPEYRKVREQAGSFMTLCKTPELACEVTLQPLRRFPLDAAILFSDILTIPDAMGLGLQFKEGEGPFFVKKIRTENDIKNLPIPEPEHDLSYVLKTIQLIQHELANKIPLIGFCGSPWTLAAYMTEGKGHSDFPTLRHMIVAEPALAHALLEKLAHAVAKHLTAQIQAGVNVVMIFDTWGGLLNGEQYREFSLHYIELIFSMLPKMAQNKRIPSILFTKGGSQWLKEMAQSGCDVLGLDWTIELNAARKITQDRVALQGNLDPACLLKSDNDIQQEVARILKSYGNGPGHIFNLGHGITPNVAPEKVALLVETVHQVSRMYHTGEKSLHE